MPTTRVQSPLGVTEELKFVFISIPCTYCDLLSFSWHVWADLGTLSTHPLTLWQPWVEKQRQVLSSFKKSFWLSGWRDRYSLCRLILVIQVQSPLRVTLNLAFGFIVFPVLIVPCWVPRGMSVIFIKAIVLVNFIHNEMCFKLLSDMIKT